MIMNNSFHQLLPPVESPKTSRTVTKMTTSSSPNDKMMMTTSSKKRSRNEFESSLSSVVAATAAVTTTIPSSNMNRSSSTTTTTTTRTSTPTAVVATLGAATHNRERYSGVSNNNKNDNHNNKNNNKNGTAAARDDDPPRRRMTTATEKSQQPSSATTATSRSTTSTPKTTSTTTVHTTTTTTNANSSSSPFRIKTGCIVAFRIGKLVSSSSFPITTSNNSKKSATTATTVSRQKQPPSKKQEDKTVVTTTTAKKVIDNGLPKITVSWQQQRMALDDDEEAQDPPQQPATASLAKNAAVADMDTTTPPTTTTTSTTADASVTRAILLPLAPPPSRNKALDDDDDDAQLNHLATNMSQNTMKTESSSSLVSKNSSKKRPRPTSTTTSTTTIDLNAPQYVAVWTDPVQSRDCGYALVGQRIRCSILVPATTKPTTTTTTTATQDKNTSTNATTTTTTKLLEGEVIRYIWEAGTGDYSASGATTTTSTKSTTMTTNASSLSFRVELLVDQHVPSTFPMLQTTGDNHIKNGKQRHRELELQIRGHDKATVLVDLQYPVVVGCHRNSNNSTNGYKWVIQKRVPSRLFGGDTTTSSTSTRSKPPRRRKQHPQPPPTQSPPRPLSSKDAKNNDSSQANPNNCNISHINGNGVHTTTVANDATVRDKITNNNNNNSPNRTSDEPAQDVKSTPLPSVEKQGIGVIDKLTPESPSKKRPRQTKSANGTSGAAKSTPKAAAAAHYHVGDGNDEPTQQISNFRWLSSRYYDMRMISSSSSLRDAVGLSEPTTLTGNVTGVTSNLDLSSSSSSWGLDMLSTGFIGEVIQVDTSASPTTTLAMVTLRPLLLPEHTAAGRVPYHQNNIQDVFFNYDTDQCDLRIQVPIEYVVIVGRKLHIGSEAVNMRKRDATTNDLFACYTYSLTHNLYMHETGSEPSAADVTFTNGSISVSNISGICHGCRRIQSLKDLVQCESEECLLASFDSDAAPTRWCRPCLDVLSKTDTSMSANLPCCDGRCDCCYCSSANRFCRQHELISSLEAIADSGSPVDSSENKPDVLLLSASTIRSLNQVDFTLPGDFLDRTSIPVPQAKPVTRIKVRTVRKVKRTMSPNPNPRRPRTPPPQSSEMRRAAQSMNDDETPSVEPKPQIEDYSVFKPGCAKEIAYDPTQKGQYRVGNGEFTSTKAARPRNFRELQERSNYLITEKKDELTKASSSSRAARLSQRRLLKDVAAFADAAGSTSSGLIAVDTLSSRESSLRFDRSGIHAWGVFADVAIGAGEMIVEYRGELIGNAVAERREIEYEHAKIGSDYMFRIDAMNVCDATKQGNVARFINASCDPNCYTKIISHEGTKRIVIYAKKDIKAGDELCYDYKFPIEYDESKRIPCHCGARECRGFMNWNKRYVVVPNNAATKSEQDTPNRDHRSPIGMSPDEVGGTNNDPGGGGDGTEQAATM